MELAAMAPLRESPTTVLTDPAGLEALLPSLGLNDGAPQLFPDELRPQLGRGLRFRQYPEQLARYLVHLSTLGVRRYMEVGVQHGGTFVVTVECLSRFMPIELAVAVDPLNVPALRRYEELRPGRASCARTRAAARSRTSCGARVPSTSS